MESSNGESPSKVKKNSVLGDFFDVALFINLNDMPSESFLSEHIKTFDSASLSGVVCFSVIDITRENNLYSRDVERIIAAYAGSIEHVVYKASKCLFKDDSRQEFTDEARETFFFLKESFRTNINGFNSALNNWIQSNFERLKKTEGCRTREEMVHYGLLLSTFYFVQAKNVTCTLTAFQKFSFWTCLENGPSFLNKRVRMMSLNDFRHYFCKADPFHSQLNQQLMFKHSKRKDSAEGLNFEMHRIDGLLTAAVEPYYFEDEYTDECLQTSSSPRYTKEC